MQMESASTGSERTKAGVGAGEEMPAAAGSVELELNEDMRCDLDFDSLFGVNVEDDVERDAGARDRAGGATVETPNASEAATSMKTETTTKYSLE